MSAPIPDQSSDGKQRQCHWRKLRYQRDHLHEQLYHQHFRADHELAFKQPNQTTAIRILFQDLPSRLYSDDGFYEVSLQFDMNIGYNGSLRPLIIFQHGILL